MYSYEDRVRAVKLYMQLGRRIAATIRQLGYPTKNALKSWHREFERCRDLPMRYVLLSAGGVGQIERISD
jgi:putative transposase